MSQVFTVAAPLEIITKTHRIVFPASAKGLSAITDVSIR